MPEYTGANGQGAPSLNGQRQTTPAEIEVSSENLASDLSRRRQLVQQERDLDYYRTFLENLVAIVRDGHAESVAQIISLIRSGASNEEIHRAVQPVTNE